MVKPDINHAQGPGPLVTLSTDFGTRDPYVAAMKGVVLNICPQARIIDLGHEIPAQGVLEGALFLAGAAPFFPTGTIHVAVVDPGVGTSRRALALRAGGQFFIGPDNGLFTFVLRQLALDEAREITNPAVMLDDVSATFHGRDVFAAAAAHLARGTAFSQLGNPIDAVETLSVPEARREGARLCGEVLHVDRFGNLVTNLHRSMLESHGEIEIRAGQHILQGIRDTYGQVGVGEALALIGGSGHLELAVRNGHAAHELGLDVGAAVEVAWS